MRPIFLFVVILLLTKFHGGDATPMANLIKKVRNQLSTFLTNAQIKQVINKVFDMAWDKKTVDQIKDEILPFGMKVVNTQQKTRALNSYNNMAKELGGSDKAEALLTILIQKLTAILNPYTIQLETVIKNQRSKGKAAAKKQTLKRANQIFVKKNIQIAIDEVKNSFSQQQCDVAFKYLAGSYLKLGQFKFKATPCKGIGT
uniref:Uncharacterized protein n=1 Tax=Panagrolaimus sp. ES5 TaxID=591445 RepID=A0AC34G768_9BILA